MSYMVLLSFEDEERALQLVESILDDYGVHIPYREGTPDDFEEVACKVEAIYKMPTQFCRMPGGCTTGKRSGGGWTMGQKWGWWVCAICKMPSKMYWESVVHKQSSFGKNLLDRLFDRETPV